MRSGAFDADASAAVAVLHGEGGVFCAGADLKAAGTEEGNRVAADGDGPMGPTRMRLSKPVIAAVAGHAVAGGLELALWCDLRVAEEDAVFGVFCRRWGVPLIDGGTVRLPRLIGVSHAMDMVLTGRAVGAHEALRSAWPTESCRSAQAARPPRQLAHELADSRRRACARTGCRCSSRTGLDEPPRSPTSSSTGCARSPRSRPASSASAPAPAGTGRSSSQADARRLDVWAETQSCGSLPRRVMMPAVRKVLLLVVVSVCAAPAPAGAAVPFEVYLGPIRVRAYEMSIVAVVKQSDGPAIVGVELDRDTGRSFPHLLGGRRFRQSHSFLVDHGAIVQIDADLKSATVRADLGRYGRIDLAASARDPNQAMSGEAIARGTFRLRPGGRYFGTITRRRFSAIIIGDVASAARTRVQPAAAARQPALVARTGLSRFGRSIVLSRSDDEEFVGLIRAGRGVFVTDMIDARSPPPSTLAAAPDLSSATLRGFGPFLSGTGSYTASSSSKNGRTAGVLSGSIAALFDTPGPLRIAHHPIPAALGGIEGLPASEPRCPVTRGRLRFRALGDFSTYTRGISQTPCRAQLSS